MKSLISVNSKFMKVNPRDLVELVLTSKYTKGMEVYINYLNDDEVSYLDSLVFFLKKHDLVLQIHGDINLDIDK